MIRGSGGFGGGSDGWGWILAEMARLFSRMMKLPVAAFVSGMEMLARAMREIQKSFDQGVDAMSNELAETFGGISNGGSGDANAALMNTGGDAAEGGAAVTRS